MSAPDREHVRQEVEIAARFEHALREAYPNRDFVICHIPCYAVSFYQLADDAPTENELLTPPEETVWCPQCEARRPYRPLPGPDPEFPDIDWGACAVCAADFVLGDRELRRVIRGEPSRKVPARNAC
jgi:hypothetical protein